MIYMYSNCNIYRKLKLICTCMLQDMFVCINMDMGRKMCVLYVMQRILQVIGYSVSRSYMDALVRFAHSSASEMFHDRFSTKVILAGHLYRRSKTVKSLSIRIQKMIT